MVLDDVADGAHLIVERAAALHAESRQIVICTLFTNLRFQKDSIQD